MPPNKVTPKKQEPIDILTQAHQIIYGDREETYGDPGRNLTMIAAHWSIHLSAVTGENITLTADDVSVMMILLKTSRLATTPKHTDSLVDIAGYAALADRINRES